MRSKFLFFLSLFFSTGALVSGVLLWGAMSGPVPRHLAKADIVSYEKIREIALRAETGKITILPYTGGPQDFAYLREYISNMAASVYGVEKNVFDTPTLLSTSLLRDLVHKVNWQMDNSLKFDKIVKAKKNLHPKRLDIAEMWRYPSWGVCGHLSWSLYNVYRSLGYDTDTIDSVKNMDDASYTTSHVTVNVYLADIGKFILQDPTFNYVVRDSIGGYLDFYEARKAAPDIRLDSLQYSLDAQKGTIFQSIPEDVAQRNIRDYFLDIYRTRIFRQGVESRFTLSLDPPVLTIPGRNGRKAVLQIKSGLSSFVF